MARFTNPANGHTEEVDGGTTAGAFFFGILYFAVKGLWRHVFIQIALIVFFFASFGAPGTLFALALWVGYAIGAQSIVSADYLRRGWTRSGEYLDASERPEPSWMTGKPAAKVQVRAAPSPEIKTCPYCAETVLKAAIKCKHCGSELTA